MELVQVTVGPPECRLQHFVELREIKIAGQFQRAGDRGFDADNPGFKSDDIGIGIAGLGHRGTMPVMGKRRKRQAGSSRLRTLGRPSGICDGKKL